MGIKDIIHKLLAKKDKYGEIAEEQRFMERLSEKKLSANERELMRYQKEDHDVAVKNALERYRKRDKKKLFHSKTALDAENIFVKKSPAILKAENIFVKEGGFRW